MYKKITLATLASAAVGLAVSMLLFVGLFGGDMETWMKENAGCLKEMSMLWWVVGSVVFALFLCLVLYRFGVTTFRQGITHGAWLTLMTALWFGIWNASTYTAYGWDWLPFDVIGNTITGAVAGGVAGWVFGRVRS